MMSWPGGDDTIVALATAVGRSAVAVVRLSGAQAIAIACALGASGLTPRRPRRVRLLHPHDGTPLDEALVTWFPAPNSYTGEAVVELSTHGGTVAPVRVLAACIAAGAREAYPGEFTRRAVQQGKLDLLQAEAIADVIDARTVAQQQVALSQLDGGLSQRVDALRTQLIHLEALLAYEVDFPEEDDGPVDRARVSHGARQLIEAMTALLATAPRGRQLRDGALVVLAGAPNVGKSSLFNALLGEARAIVTPIAGTTRDAIEALLDRTPLPLRLVDTAGLRDDDDPTQDPIEQLGIGVSQRYLGDAQVVLACGATPDELAQLLHALEGRTSGCILPVWTKGDQRAASMARSAAAAARDRDVLDATVVSAHTGEGLNRLLARIDQLLTDSNGAGAPSQGGAEVLVTRERHRLALTIACDETRAFLEGWESAALPATVAAVHLFAAREALSTLIGTVDIDDVLDRVFRDFCIGK